MTPPSLPGPFWMIGCGNMAGAMLEGWAAAGLDTGRITVVRPSGAPAGHGVTVAMRCPDGPPPALVMLGMKPYQLDTVAPDLAPHIGPGTLLVSVLAGVEQAALRARFPHAGAIVRAMPNTPVRLRKGAIGLHSDDADEGRRAFVEALMGALGHCEWVGDEALFDVVSALSGSGPAFLFRFIDALGAAGGALGLPEAQARRLALSTVAGAAALAAASDEEPGRLADRVASPGGSTRKGLDVLDEDGRLRVLLVDTLEAARARNREMAEEARRAPS